MFTAYVVVTAVTAAANAGMAAADFARADFVLANAADVGLPAWSVRYLGALKAAGAAGLLLGLLGARPLGTAAAAGLVLFFVGAIVAHLRARVLSTLAFPGTFLVLAAGCLALALAPAR
ncbi:DoxX family protein [Actinacidiphila paucisporea]|uniref:DoxX-like family protein n=1 Tax=Actinacidiphila paucisporea TaxID=310782 RepID=A0A1M7PFE8_9ACTN|nr:DoxX family protein [Actinacidiphila paucisporea]SHN15719.1 DoxX-like family protein [Actinacidiphila paucisporea]